MARSTRISALALILLASGLQAQDVRITIEGSITSAEVLGTVVKGSMQLTIVNATDAQLRNVSLRLATPASGSFGEGSVEIGTIDVDETAVPIVPFQIESEFLNGSEPPVVTLSYDDSGGARRDANIAVRRKPEGGGL